MLRAVARGIENLEELDKLECIEQEEKEAELLREQEQTERERTASATPIAQTSFTGFDWEAFDASLEVDPALLALGDPGIGGGTGPQLLRQSPSIS